MDLVSDDGVVRLDDDGHGSDLEVINPRVAGSFVMEWTCETCTFLNKSQVDTCEMCGKQQSPED